MNYVIDNTITDPADATGYVIGSSFLVPPAGAEAEWFGKEDQIATWGGFGWSFYSPPTAAEYQVTSGPNAGRVYVRTATSSSLTNIVPNGSLALDVAGFAEWTIVQEDDATVAWGAGQLVLTSDYIALDGMASAKVTFPTIVGVAYKLVYDILGSDVDPTDNRFGGYVLRNESTSTDVTSNGFPTGTIGESELFFTATHTSYSFKVWADGGSGVTPASVILGTVTVTREAERLLNGDFESSLTEWTAPAPPWDTDSGGAAPLVGTYAFATIDYSGHDPFPALEQEIADLTIGRSYRVAFDVSGNFTRGYLSLAVDDQVIVDVTASGSYSYYFKASATTHTLQFPLTKVGPSVFELSLDNVSVVEALWVASPMLKMQGYVGTTAALRLNVTGSMKGRMAAQSGAALSLLRTRPLAGTMAAQSGALLAASRTKVTELSGTMAAIASGVMHLRHSPLLSGTIAISSAMTGNLSDLGYFTVKQAVDSILSLWTDLGCGCSDGGCSPLQTEALERLNAAIQKLHASGQEWGYVSTVALTISPVSNASEIILPRNVLHVKRCVFRPAIDEDETTFASLPLRPIKTRHECESFRLSTPVGVWPLSSAEASLSGLRLPLGYFTEAEDPRDGSAGGPPALRILFAPEFNGEDAWKVDLQVAVLPPRYVCNDLQVGTRLDIPNRFAETLLMPLARYYALSSRYFRKPELRETVIAQAADVLGLLGELQPAQPEAAKEPKPSR